MFLFVRSVSLVVDVSGSPALHYSPFLSRSRRSEISFSSPTPLHSNLSIRSQSRIIWKIRYHSPSLKHDFLFPSRTSKNLVHSSFNDDVTGFKDRTTSGKEPRTLFEFEWVLVGWEVYSRGHDMVQTSCTGQKWSFTPQETVGPWG